MEINLSLKRLTLQTLVLIGLGLFTMASCQKKVTVTNHPPKVYADSSRTITLPLDSVSLHGSAVDTNGKVVAWLWSEVSGPNVPVIRTEGSPSTVISNLVAGTYVFQLMVLDSAGETGVAFVTVNVNTAASQPVSYTLNTGSGTPFEMHLMGNANSDISQYPAPELDAVAWTRFGDITYGRAAFRFDMSGVPAGKPVKSAYLSLYSNHTPNNGDLVNANSGTTNAFYITRISSSWNPQTTTWAAQPATDTVGQVLIPQSTSSFQDVINVDVTTMVNRMIANGNYGFKIQLQNETIYNSRIFYSSAVTDSTKRPALVVNY